MELRAVCREVGSLSEARAMPVEIRRWWISEMQKEQDARRRDFDAANKGVRTQDVR